MITVALNENNCCDVCNESINSYYSWLVKKNDRMGLCERCLNVANWMDLDPKLIRKLAEKVEKTYA